MEKSEVTLLVSIFIILCFVVGFLIAIKADLAYLKGYVGECVKISQ
jgi:hypothetical protein